MDRRLWRPAWWTEWIDSCCRKLEASIAERAKHWQRDFSSPEAYQKSIEPNRQRLAHILGVRDARAFMTAWKLVGENNATGDGREGRRLRGSRGALAPHLRGRAWRGTAPAADRSEWRQLADVVAIPDADQTPEMIAGLLRRATESQYARRLAESGCRVLVPTLVNRISQPTPRKKITNREFLYRSAFELGRHLIGYEIQKVLAGVDWFSRRGGAAMTRRSAWSAGRRRPAGPGAAALDPRIDVACVSGHFRPREKVWQEPIDRNVFGPSSNSATRNWPLMVAPRPLVVKPPWARGRTSRPRRRRRNPARQNWRTWRAEVARAKDSAGFRANSSSGDGSGSFGSAPPRPLKQSLDLSPPGRLLVRRRPTKARCVRCSGPPTRQMHEIDRHSQWFLLESPYVREEFIAKLDTSSLEKFEKTIEPYREIFYNEVIGRFDYGPAA